MHRTTDQDLLRLNAPGIVIEIDPRTAEELGAFEEFALTEVEALESADIPPEHNAGPVDEEGA